MCSRAEHNKPSVLRPPHYVLVLPWLEFLSKSKRSAIWSMVAFSCKYQSKISILSGALVAMTAKMNLQSKSVYYIMQFWTWSWNKLQWLSLNLAQTPALNGKVLYKQGTSCMYSSGAPYCAHVCDTWHGSTAHIRSIPYTNQTKQCSNKTNNQQGANSLQRGL